MFWNLQALSMPDQDGDLTDQEKKYLLSYKMRNMRKWTQAWETWSGRQLTIGEFDGAWRDFHQEDPECPGTLHQFIAEKVMGRHNMNSNDHYNPVVINCIGRRMTGGKLTLSPFFRAHISISATQYWLFQCQHHPVRNVKLSDGLACTPVAEDGGPYICCGLRWCDRHLRIHQVVRCNRIHSFLL